MESNKGGSGALKQHLVWSFQVWKFVQIWSGIQKDVGEMICFESDGSMKSCKF